MFIDPVIRAIRWPFDFVRTKIFRVTSIKGGIRADIRQVQMLGGQYKDMARSGAARAKDAGARIGKVEKKPKPAAEGKKKKASMGFFAKKKKCPSCGQKLLASWDKCPYCQWSEQPAAAAPVQAAPVVQAAPAAAPMPTSSGGRMRTMSINVNEPDRKAHVVCWLVPLDGPQIGDLFQLKPRSSIGTANDCDVVLREGSISGRHAEFTVNGTGFRISDLGSTNGTFVNDKRITTSDLVDGDSVKLGRVNFKFKAIT